MTSLSQNSNEVREDETLEMAEETDPYASLSDQCKISSSQENLLQHSFFAHGAQPGLIPLSTPNPSSPSSSTADPDEFPVENTGIIICSLPEGSSKDTEEEHDGDGGGTSHPTVEEEFQTPEEQFMVCSSEKEQPRRMDIDEYLDSRTHDDGDDEEEVEDVDGGRLDDAGTVDLGKESNSMIFPGEDLSLGNGSSMLGTVPVDDVEKCSENENGGPRIEPEENEILVTKSPMQEDLGFPRAETEGLGKSPCNNPIEAEKMLTLDVVDNVEGGDVAVKTLELSVEKNLGVSKCSSDSLPRDSEKALESTLETIFGLSEKTPESTVEKNIGVLRCGSDSLPSGSEKASSMRNSLIQEDLGLPELRNEGLGASPCNHQKEFENNRNLNVVDDVELTAGEDCEGGVAEKTLESAMENLGCLERGKSPESLVAVGNENVVGINASNKLDLKSRSDNSKEDFPVLQHSDVPESSKDIVMEDSAPNEIQEDIGQDVITDNVPHFDNMQTDELHDDGKPSNNSKEELEKSEHADSSDHYPEVTSGNPAGLRRLPNWAEGSDGAMEDSTQSGNRRARKEKNPDSGGKKKEADILGHGGIILEGEGSNHGGKRFGEAEGSSRVIEEDLGHGRIRSVEASDHGGKRIGEAESSSRVAEALASGDQPQAIKNFLDAIYFRVNNRSGGNDAKGNTSQRKDILEVATRAGLKVSRPRWWKSEGYEP